MRICVLSHGANDEVADKRDKHGKPRLQMQRHEWRIKWPSATKWHCKQKLYHPADSVYKKTCEKETPILVVKLFESSTSIFLHCRLNQRSVNVWQQVIPPSDNLRLCHWKGRVHGVVHRDCLTNKEGGTWKPQLSDLIIFQSTEKHTTNSAAASNFGTCGNSSDKLPMK